MDIGNKPGGLSEECVSTDTACFGRGNVDELTCGFAAEWAEEKGVWIERGMIRRRVVTRIGETGRMNVEAFTNELATRTCFFQGATAYRTSLRHCRLIRREKKREASCISGTRRWQGSRPEYIGDVHPQTSEGQMAQHRLKNVRR